MIFTYNNKEIEIHDNPSCKWYLNNVYTLKFTCNYMKITYDLSLIHTDFSGMQCYEDNIQFVKFTQSNANNNNNIINHLIMPVPGL